MPDDAADAFVYATDANGEQQTFSISSEDHVIKPLAPRWAAIPWPEEQRSEISFQLSKLLQATARLAQANVLREVQSINGGRYWCDEAKEAEGIIAMRASLLVQVLAGIHPEEGEE